MLPIRRQGPRSAVNLRALADEELMELVAAGNAVAFEAVLERHVDAAFSLAHRILGKPALAEDVVQDALLAVWRAGSRYDSSQASVRTWMLGIVHHRAIDALRRGTVHDARRVGDEHLAEELPGPAQTELEVQRRDDADQIRSALEQLPAEQTRVIELAYYGGFTHAEIATIIDIPLGTVKGRMRLGLEKLRDQLVAQEQL